MTTRGRSYLQQRGLRQNSNSRYRLMPETILASAADQAEARRLLRLYGYIGDETAITRGRALVADERRIRRNERRREQRAAIKSANKPPETATGAGSGGGRINGHTASASSFEPEGEAHWTARQDALPFKFNGARLWPREVEFAERMYATGDRIEWLKPHRYKATNDFLWHSNGGIEVELKSTAAHYETIRRAIKESVDNPWIPKKHFIVDLGHAELTEDLRQSLSRYNLDRSNYQIERLWIMSQDGRAIDEIRLAQK